MPGDKDGENQESAVQDDGTDVSSGCVCFYFVVIIIIIIVVVIIIVIIIVVVVVVVVLTIQETSTADEAREEDDDDSMYGEDDSKSSAQDVVPTEPETPKKERKLNQRELLMKKWKGMVRMSWLQYSITQLILPLLLLFCEFWETQ